MHINKPNNKRYLVVDEEVHDRCVVTSATVATWRNVYVVVVQFLVIGLRSRNALLLQMSIG